MARLHSTLRALLVERFQSVSGHNRDCGFASNSWHAYWSNLANLVPNKWRAAKAILVGFILNTPVQATYHRTDESDIWKNLFRIGGAAALIIGIFYVIEIILVATTGVPPSTVAAWFALLQNNRALGLFDLFPLDIVSVVLSIPVFLALYIALRRTSQTWMLIATALAFVSLADYFATNTALSMLSLSNQYAQQQPTRRGLSC
jgi:hypothetical protein